jgi:hypothetical protein
VVAEEAGLSRSPPRILPAVLSSPAYWPQAAILLAFSSSETPSYSCSSAQISIR